MIICEYAVENEVPIIYIFGRDKNGKRTIKKDSDFKPYFYCRREDATKFGKDSRVLNVKDIDVKDIDGNKISKITVKIPKYVKELRKGITSYEADVLYPIRYTIDNYKEIEGVPLLVVYIDIETNSTISFPNIQAAQDEITIITVFNNLSRKCITFVWREDLDEKTIHNGIKSFKTVNKEDYKYDDYTMYFDDERKMLRKFLKYVNETDPDMFTGWNVKDFDMRYILNRMNTIGIDFTKLSPMNVALTNEWGDVIIKGRIIFDMLAAYRNMNYGELENFKLDNVSLAELGEKKIPRPIVNGKEISHGEFWRTNLPLFIEYNKKDVMLVYQIQKKKQIIQQFDEVRRMSKCSFNDVFLNLRIVDSFVLSFCKERYILPTKGTFEKEKFGGGKVLTPKKGMYEWIIVEDCKALYPKIISSIHASPETIVPYETPDTVNLNIPHIVTPEMKGAKLDKLSSEFDKFFEEHWNLEKQKFNQDIPINLQPYLKFKKVHFRQDIKGFIPEILEYLFDERIKMQKERDKHEYGSSEYNRLEFKQYAFKVLMNSFYGVLGHHGFRLYRPEIAASITFVGRNVVLWNKKIAKENGYETLYGDTDSTFIISNTKTESENLQTIIDEGTKICIFLQQSYDEFAKFFNLKKHCLQIEFEKIYKKIFFGQAKKRYAGKLAWYKGKEANNIQIVGFEVVRSDQSLVARSTQEEVFTLLMKDKHDKKEVIDYVKGIMKSIKEDKYDYESLGIPTPLNKQLSEYKTNKPVVRAVTYSNRKLKLDIRPGEKFYLIYVKNIPGEVQTDVVAIRENSDMPANTVFDYEKHINEATKDKMTAIFDGLGWSLIELTNQTSITDY